MNGANYNTIDKRSIHVQRHFLKTERQKATAVIFNKRWGYHCDKVAQDCMKTGFSPSELRFKTIEAQT